MGMGLQELIQHKQLQAIHHSMIFFLVCQIGGLPGINLKITFHKAFGFIDNVMFWRPAVKDKDSVLIDGAIVWGKVDNIIFRNSLPIERIWF